MAITTDAQGYQSYVSDPGSAMAQNNPWTQISQQDSAAQVSGTQAATQMQSQISDQMSSMQNDGSQYPALQNQWGLGSTPGSASAPSYGAAPVTINMPDSGSRGFNPWSMQGEANARGK